MTATQPPVPSEIVSAVGEIRLPCDVRTIARLRRAGHHRGSCEEPATHAVRLICPEHGPRPAQLMCTRHLDALTRQLAHAAGLFRCECRAPAFVEWLRL